MFEQTLRVVEPFRTRRAGRDISTPFHANPDHGTRIDNLNYILTTEGVRGRDGVDTVNAYQEEVDAANPTNVPG